MSNHLEERRRMISEAFHTLNQPLTGLHCGLEIALQKPRTEGEYRTRIATGLEHAGVILQLVRAIRQLVEADDPGERFGTVDLVAVLAQLRGELDVVSEALQVPLTVNCEASRKVMADPGKLVAALGTFADERMRMTKPGAQVEINVNLTGDRVMLTMGNTASRVKTDDHQFDRKLSEIRCDAARCYIWTIGGEVESSDGKLSITLPPA